MEDSLGRKVNKNRSASLRDRLQQLRWRRLLAISAACALGGIAAIFFILTIAYFVYARGMESPTEVIAATGANPSVVYDRNGDHLHTFVDPLAGLRHPVPLSEMSPYLVAATVSTEDASFYNNPGFDPRGIARAFTSNLPEPLGEGLGNGVGGSTITQQLARNLYISPEERFDQKVGRKIKELVIGLELKRRYSDDQILEWYLNQIYYGNFAYGVEAAAQSYFGKSAQTVTLAEAALLVGLPQAPSTYAPITPEARELAVQRQHEVLDLMVNHGYITEEDAATAKEEELTIASASFDIQAPHFVFYVQDQVTRMCEDGVFSAPNGVACDQVVFRGGLRIVTSLDLGLQEAAEATVEDVVSSGEARHGGHNGALVAIWNPTGEIMAYVGSRDFFNDEIQGQVDIATSQRSHGSTMKSLTYLTAFEDGWVPSTIVEDTPLVLDAGGGQRREVNNWNFAHLGNITVRKALSESVNVSAVRTLMDVGGGNMRETSHRLGVTDLREENCGPTITLGSCGVKLLDMTYAYSAIANNGTMKGNPTIENLPGGFRELDPISVVEIKDASGDTLYQQENEEEQVVDPAYAYMITHILSNQAISWSGLRIDRPAATKSGTSEEFKDSLVIGYTPDITVGVWMGNADGTAMERETFSSVGAGPMWRTFMQEAVEYLGVSSKQFQVPSNIEVANCAGVEEVFVRGQQPTQPGTCRAPSASSPTPSATPSGSPTPSPSVTPTPSQTASPTPSPTTTATPTQSPTAVPSSTASPTPTATATPTPIASGTPLPTAPSNSDSEDED